jgi:two-component system sensor histidine kinase UhpB
LPKPAVEVNGDLGDVLSAVSRFSRASAVMSEAAAAIPYQAEALRLQALHRYDILDTPAEQSFDDLVRLACQICATPIALISFVDAERQWLKAKVGLAVSQTPREISFCTHALSGVEMFEVADVLADARFRGNPFVTEPPHIRFYAAAPLLTPEGHALGTLCVLDRVARKLTPEQQDTLKMLARQVMTSLEVRRHTAQLERNLSERERATQALRESQERLQALSQNVPGMVYQFLRKSDGYVSFPYASEGCYALFGVLPETLIADANWFQDMIFPKDRQSYEQSMRDSAEKLITWNWEGRIKMRGWNDTKWINLRATPRPFAGGAVQWEGMMSNITQSKRAQAALDKSRAELRELQSHVERVKEQERTRISREIHDDIGGTLTAVKIDLSWLAHRLPRQEPRLMSKAAAIEQLIDHVMETTRRIARDLRPGILDLGLVPAIEWQTQEFQKRTGIACELSCEPEDLELDPDVSVTLFRVFQETLTNVTKHAHATQLSVKLAVSEGHIVLVVEDNGRGIEPGDMAKPSSFGIRGMQERSRHLGGSVAIAGEPGHGTTVTLRVPVTMDHGSRNEMQQTL